MGNSGCLAKPNTNDENIPTGLVKQKPGSEKKLIATLLKEFNNEKMTHLFSNIDLQNFHVEKVIGRGNYAKIYLVKKVDPETFEVQFYALKVVKKSQMFKRNQEHNIQAEKEVLIRGKHPFLIQLHYSFQSPERIYFVVDYINGGDLFFHLKKMKKFSEKDAKFYACEIILGLEFLHKKGFVYRDLKPENVLIDSEGHVKLTDFGLAKRMDFKQKEKTLSFCGTPNYLAPEIMEKVGYDYMVDWWALGIILYELVAGVPPFLGSNQYQVIANIMQQDYNRKDFFSREFTSLIDGLLIKDPLKRLGINRDGFEAIENIKSHPFFAGVDWESVANKELQPPFKPTVAAENDVKNFDKLFLKEKISATPHETMGMTVLNKMHLMDFTFDENNTKWRETCQDYEIKNHNQKSFHQSIIESHLESVFEDIKQHNSTKEDHFE